MVAAVGGGGWWRQLAAATLAAALAAALVAPGRGLLRPGEEKRDWADFFDLGFSLFRVCLYTID
jgi:hypothetical protein